MNLEFSRSISRNRNLTEKTIH